MRKKIIIAGSSGFIGGHLVRKLKSQGHYVIGIDIVQPKYEHPDKFYLQDLRYQVPTLQIFSANRDVDEVYLLSCLMGGLGFIGDITKSYDIMVGSSQIVSNVIQGCVEYGAKKLFYSSSACVYNMNLQDKEDSAPLKESDALPAWPDLVYGWQKLMGEIMCQSAYDQYGLEIRIARFHNIFGHEGIWDGGKEKAPAALCRKVAKVSNGGVVEVWGDGKQRRSFLFIDECLEGVERLMLSNVREPVNIGSDEDVSINQMIGMLMQISNKDFNIEHDLTKPQGVRSRNSDNSNIKKLLGWSPSLPLYHGLSITYEWIKKQIESK